MAVGQQKIEDGRRSRVHHPWSSWTARICLVSLILLAFALRVHRLDAQSLWYDEGVTAQVAQWGVVELTRWTADDIQPPLYYYVVAGWGRLAGWTEWSLRFPSVFFGLLLVPLLAVVARKSSRSGLTGIVAALFAALHPLLLYYGQEARMYSLLVTLGGLAGYLILRILESRASEQQNRLWFLYALVASTAVYTHYFAFFLLGAFALLVSWELLGRRAGGRSQWLPFIAAHLLIGLLYLPWMATLVTRLTVDASYWQGALKWEEAIRHVAITFTSGETVLEAQGIRLLWLYAVISIVALAGFFSARPGRGSALRMAAPISPLTLGLLWLIAPLLGILALASLAPKFNPRYGMVALPGLLLLWSGGLGSLLGSLTPLWLRVRGKACSTEFSALPGLMGLVAAGLLVSGFVYADRNWFVEPAYTKAQWRELAGYVRARRQPDEAVILVSGHAWPVWHYYAPDIDPIRLPGIEILDVNAVLDFANSGQALTAALAGSTGVWLVTWQDEVVDPMGVTALHLELAGSELPTTAAFWQLGLRHFTAVDGERIVTSPPTPSPVEARFGDQVQLLGHTVLGKGDLVLFWESMQLGPLPDLYLTGETRTATGLPYAELGDRRLSVYNYPTFRWQPNQVTVSRIPALQWAGPAAMPGNYTVSLGVYDPVGDPAGLDLMGNQGTPSGKRAFLAVTLPAPTLPPPGLNPTGWPLVASGVQAQVRLQSATVEPGQRLDFEILWYVQNEIPGSQAELTVDWVPDAGVRPLVADVAPVTPDFSGAAWPVGQVLRTVHSLAVDPDLPMGAYTLGLGLNMGEKSALAVPVTVGTVTRTFRPPTLALKVDAVLGKQMMLLGLTEPVPAQVRVSDLYVATLVWQAMSTPRLDYMVSLQWLGADGLPAAQIDLPLPGPSSEWLPGQVELQRMHIPIPRAAGIYQLVAVVYDGGQAGLPRLRQPDGQDWVLLGTVSVVD